MRRAPRSLRPRSDHGTHCRRGATQPAPDAARRFPGSPSICRQRLLFCPALAPLCHMRVVRAPQSHARCGAGRRGIAPDSGYVTPMPGPRSPAPPPSVAGLRALPAARAVLPALEGTEGVHVVGGGVRDPLLGRPRASSTFWSRATRSPWPACRGRLGATGVHERFGTATVPANVIALTSRRAGGDYPRPGALPDVGSARRSTRTSPAATSRSTPWPCGWPTASDRVAGRAGGPRRADPARAAPRLVPRRRDAPAAAGPLRGRLGFAAEEHGRAARGAVAGGAPATVSGSRSGRSSAWPASRSRRRSRWSSAGLGAALGPPSRPPARRGRGDRLGPPEARADLAALAAALSARTGGARGGLRGLGVPAGDAAGSWRRRPRGALGRLEAGRDGPRWPTGRASRPRRLRSRRRWRSARRGVVAAWLTGAATSAWRSSATTCSPRACTGPPWARVCGPRGPRGWTAAP